MKSLITKLLRAQALRAVRANKPIIIAVTGSYGKTSAKDAIAGTLQELLPKGSVRYPKKSFNNEFGVPLSILGFDSPGRSLFGWISLLAKGCVAKIPSVLVLEVGADHKGEIQSWASALKPHIAVITGISPVHVANYASYDELKEEKASLGMHATRVVLLNGDDKTVREMETKFTTPVKFFGSKEGSAYRITAGELMLRSDRSYDIGETMTQLQGTIRAEGVEEACVLRNATGTTALSAALIAFAVTHELQEMAEYPFVKSAPHEIVAAIAKNWKPTVGRMNPLPGIKGTLILDDSYNAAPAAVEHGLHVLGSFPSHGRKIAALGRMAELGSMSDEAHAHMGQWVAAAADFFVAVGEEPLLAVEEAKKYGMDTGSIRWFADSKQAGRFLDGMVEKGDIIYVKGSQSARMEFIVKDLLAEPGRAADLLVRQEAQWLK